MYAFKVTSFNYLRGFIEEMGVSRGLSTYPFSLLDQHLRKNIISRWEKECLQRNFAIGQLRFKSIGFKLPRVLIFYLLVKFIYSEKVTKFCKIFTLILSYVVPVKSKVEILQNFVAFLEYMNFTTLQARTTLSFEEDTTGKLTVKASVFFNCRRNRQTLPFWTA